MSWRHLRRLRFLATCKYVHRFRMGGSYESEEETVEGKKKIMKKRFRETG